MSEHATPEQNATPPDRRTGWERPCRLPTCGCGKSAEVFPKPGERFCGECMRALLEFRKRLVSQ